MKLVVILLCMVTVSLAQNFNEITFSELMQKSDLIIKAKIISLESRWGNDNRGKHIYTFTNFKIEKVLKGFYDKDQLTMEIAGGTVGDMTEYVSNSIIVKENQEMILFLSSQIIYSNASINKKFNVIENKVFLENKSVPVENFATLIRNIIQNRLEAPKTLEDVEKLMDTMEIKYEKINYEGIDSLRTVKAINILDDVNLTPYKPNGWSSEIVVSTANNMEANLLETDNLYIKWAVINNGSNDINNSFKVNLYVDGLLVDWWNANSLRSGYYTYVTNYSLGRLASGSHTIKITADPANSVIESNETDNDFSKNINIEAVAGIPSITLISPSSASAGTGTIVTINGSNFGNVRGNGKVEFFYKSGQPKIESNNYVSWTDTRIECEVPIGTINNYAASAGSGPVTITTANGSSGGYYYTITYGYGMIKWSENPAIIHLRINENTNDLVGEGAEIISAASTWNAAGANFAFVYDGTTTQTYSTSDGINQIMWGSTSSSLATAYYWSSGNNMVEADIVFNDSYNWSKDNSNYDVQTVALHELGHWLNLRDLYGGNDFDKVMYGITSFGTTKRNLTTSDIEGIRWIYGVGTPVLYTVVTSSNPTMGGSANGSGSYYGSTSVTVSAVANTGYTFLNWTENGNIVSTISNYTFTISGNRTLVANFALSTYTLIVTSNNGTVTKNPNQTNYNYGSSVILTATPSIGYTFTGWNGDATGSTNPLTITMNGNKSITANFAINTYTLTVTSVNGTVSKNPNQTNYNYGTTVTLTATPSTGYTFTGWSGDATGSTNPLTVTMNGNKSITANFAINTYTLTVNATNGTVTKNPNQANYNYGSTVQLTVTPSIGYTFTGWSGDATGSTNPLTVMMNSNKNITANFAINRYSVTLTADPTTGGTVTGNGTYDYGSSITVLAVAKNITGSKFQFINWNENGSEVSKSASYTFTIIANRNLVANFLDITSVNDEGGIPTKFVLSQNYPNPFNPTTKIQFSLPKEVMVRLSVYNAIGQEFAILVNQELPASTYSVDFNGANLPSGIYFYRVQAGDFNSNKKMILLK